MRDLDDLSAFASEYFRRVRIFPNGTVCEGCRVMSATNNGNKQVYWHRDLPPIDAELMSEHTMETTSSRVAGTIAHRDELWDRCYDELMAKTNERLTQEIARLGGHYAHVHDESVDTRRDDAKGEAWLRGRFSYMLYRRHSYS
jgi:hypothetical protein